MIQERINKGGKIPLTHYKKVKMLNIKELLDRLNEGETEKTGMIDLAKVLWPDSSERTKRANISRLATGYSKSIKIEHVHELCKLLKCTKDELFGTSKEIKNV